MMKSELTERLIFCPPPPGKPNPQQAYDPEKKRERVPQAAQKGATCWFYAANFLRQRCGKYSPDDPMRPMEAKISAVRKKQTQLDEALNRQSDMVRTLAGLFGGSKLTRAQAERLLESGRFPRLPLLQQFCVQKGVEDLSTYLRAVYCKESMEIVQQLLVSVTAKSLEQWYNETKPYPKSWGELNIEESFWFSQWCLRLTLQIQFGFMGAPWHPGQTLDELFQVLKTHGPLLVFGRLGRSYYQSPPFQLTHSIAGRTIFGWKPNAPKDLERGYHSVVVVGVDLDNKVVYFLDPNDRSGPDPKDQSVYVTSYEKFKASLVDISGREGYDENWKRLQATSSTFAYYHPSGAANYN